MPPNFRNRKGKFTKRDPNEKKLAAQKSWESRRIKEMVDKILPEHSYSQLASECPEPVQEVTIDSNEVKTPSDNLDTSNPVKIGDNRDNGSAEQCAQSACVLPCMPA